jgi:predicted Rossmann fold flavoprotein
VAPKVPQIARLDRARRSCDVLVVGAGAAGLFAGLAARGALGPKGGVAAIPPGAPDVVLLNNEARLGLKILVSGGGRCNLTNAQVDERDYLTDTPKVVRSLLRSFPSEAVRSFFQDRGLKQYEEPLGKVFPATNKARDVLGRLLEAVQESGIDLVAPAEVTAIRPPTTEGEGWVATLADGSSWRAKRLVLATGGKSLPKTGSRGFGFQALASLGHTVERAVPALTPLLLQPGGPLDGLAGLTIPAVLTLAPQGANPDQLSGSKFKPLARSAGSLLVTHRGATGPAPFDVSGPCGSALARGEEVRLSADFWSLGEAESAWAPFRDLDKAPGAALRPEDAPRPPTREAFEASAAPLLAERERGIAQAFASRLPRKLLQSLCRGAGIDPSKKVKQLDTRERRALFLALTQCDLGLSGVEGYAKAEVTAGGVRLDELQRKTLESKLLPGLHCCGEVVNVTGRLGGFNFQWAWSSGYAAGRGAAAGLSRSG